MSASNGMILVSRFTIDSDKGWSFSGAEAIMTSQTQQQIIHTHTGFSSV
jgi:hypothetical protein